MGLTRGLLSIWLWCRAPRGSSVTTLCSWRFGWWTAWVSSMQLSAWKAEEVKGPGGRPMTFPTARSMVALVVCALSDQPLHLTRVCQVMFRQLSPAWRDALRIPDPPPEHDRRAWDACYRNVRTRFHDMVDLMDPSTEPKNRRLDHEAFTAQTKERRARLTEAQWDERYERLEWFINQILEASIKLVPREVIRNWKGSVGVDATLVKSPARAQKQRRLTKSRRVPPEVLVHSADPGAAWYRRDGDHRDDIGEEEGATGRGKLAWGREATMVISGSESPEGDQEFPNLAVGMAVLHPPGHDVGRNGARGLASVRARGHPANFLAADRAYSSAKERDFQLPANALGYRAVYDYKIDQLGVKGSHEGFLLIEGAFYCPSIPKPLIDAALDFREGRSMSPPIAHVSRSVGTTWPAPRPSPTPRVTSDWPARRRIDGLWSAVSSSRPRSARRTGGGSVSR